MDHDHTKLSAFHLPRIVRNFGAGLFSIAVLAGCGNTTPPQQDTPVHHNEEFSHLPDITFLSHDLFSQSTHLNATWNDTSLIQEDVATETLTMQCQQASDSAVTTLQFLLPLQRYDFSGGIHLSPQNLYPVSLQISTSTPSESTTNILIEAVLQPGQLLTFHEVIENTSSDSSLIIRCQLPQQAQDNTHAVLTFSYLTLEGWYE